MSSETINPLATANSQNVRVGPQAHLSKKFHLGRPRNNEELPKERHVLRFEKSI